MRTDRAPDQPFLGNVIESALAPIPLSRGEHERQVGRTASFAEALRKRDQKLFGNCNPDEPPDRQRVTIDDQFGGRLGRDHLRAPPTCHGAMLSDSRARLIEATV